MAESLPAKASDNGATGWRDLGMAVLVFCATIATYLPSLRGEFIWNDLDYVTAPSLRPLSGLGAIWTQPGATEQYYPILHSAFWVQFRLFGMQPLGYHVVTLLLHISAAILFALFLRRLAVPGAWLAALLFALHPVHVESVAWITEQKNTLSLVFYLAAALAYMRFDETRANGDYAAAFGLFVLSLLSKTVTGTLPAALLLVLWWKLGRLDLRRNVAPLLPWFVVAVAAGLFASWVEQYHVGAQGDDFALPMVERGLVAGRAIWSYLGRIVWPFGLNFIYPRWTPDTMVWWQWLFPLGALGLASVLWLQRARTRAPLAAFLLFTGSLFPVLGFVNLYGAIHSWTWDHWQYLPDLAPLALIAAGLVRGGQSLPAPWRRWNPALAGLLVLALGALTWRHTALFHDDQTLYRTTLVRNPAAWMPHNNLANLLIAQPDREAEALVHYQAVIRLRPDYPEGHVNLANLLAKMRGREEEALACYEQALRIKPDHADAHHWLANLLACSPAGRRDALSHYEEALRLKPDDAEVHYNYGVLLEVFPDRQPGALVHYEQALRLNPNFTAAHYNLANVLSKIPGQETGAIAHYEAALRLDPGLAPAHYNLGVVLLGLPGRRREAVSHFQAALRIDPDFSLARAALDQLRGSPP